MQGEVPKFCAAASVRGVRVGGVFDDAGRRCLFGCAERAEQRADMDAELTRDCVG